MRILLRPCAGPTAGEVSLLLGHREAPHLNPARGSHQLPRKEAKGEAALALGTDKPGRHSDLCPNQPCALERITGPPCTWFPPMETGMGQSLPQRPAWGELESASSRPVGEPTWAPIQHPHTLQGSPVSLPRPQGLLGQQREAECLPASSGPRPVSRLVPCAPAIAMRKPRRARRQSQEGGGGCRAQS